MVFCSIRRQARLDRPTSAQLSPLAGYPGVWLTSRCEVSVPFPLAAVWSWVPRWATPGETGGTTQKAGDKNRRSARATLIVLHAGHGPRWSLRGCKNLSTRRHSKPLEWWRATGARQGVQKTSAFGASDGANVRRGGSRWSPSGRCERRSTRG